MLNEFEANGVELRDEQVLFDAYDTEQYEGYAFVLIEREDGLYEVNASHCSCYGLEGQWDEEKTTAEALRARFQHRQYGVMESQEDRDALMEILRRYA